MAILNGKIVPIEIDNIQVGIKLTTIKFNNEILSLTESSSGTCLNEEYLPLCHDGLGFNLNDLNVTLSDIITFVNTSNIPLNGVIGLDANHIIELPENPTIKMGKKQGIRKLISVERVG